MWLKCSLCSKNCFFFPLLPAIFCELPITKTPYNSNLFRFPFKVRVIGSQLYWTFGTRPLIESKLSCVCFVRKYQCPSIQGFWQTSWPKGGEINGVLTPDGSPGGRAARLSIDCSISTFDGAGAACDGIAKLLPLCYLHVCVVFFFSGHGLAGLG